MATTKKKPSAAQLTARKKFAAIMKSGGFGVKKKRVVKRKNNPAAAMESPIIRVNPIKKITSIYVVLVGNKAKAAFSDRQKSIDYAHQCAANATDWVKVESLRLMDVK
jgi:hypothetical protein